MYRRAFVISLFAALPLLAKPNLSGEWKMNAVKSDYGPLPAPQSFVRKISHEDPKLNLKTTQVGAQGEITTDVTWTTDGKESVNTIAGAEVRGTAQWEGDDLVLNYKRNIQGMEFKMKEVWAVSDAGKTITINLTASSEAGEFVIKIVLEKQ
ncbi:MAG: hypothetical protein ACRD44_10365 [Bryobacteraceae bacterium]